MESSASCKCAESSASCKCKEPSARIQVQGAKCVEPSASCKCMESSASCKCKESSASCKCKESSASCNCVEPSASCKCVEPSASCKCKESSAIDLRGVKNLFLGRWGSAEDTTRKSTRCGDRRGRGAKTRGFLLFLTCSRDPLRGSAWSRCTNPCFFCVFFNMLARPSAGIGVVEVQKPKFVLRFLIFPRDPLRESAWSRCKNSRFFAIFNMLARPSAGIGVVEVQNSCFFSIFDMLARPPAGIGMVEVQKLEFFVDLCGARTTLCGSRRGRGAKTQGFCGFCCSNWSSGVVSWFARFSRDRRVAGSIPPWSAGGRRKMQLA